MFQLYRKNKAAMILTLLSLIGAAALVVSGIILSKGTGLKFHTDGYLMDVVVDETNHAMPQMIRFSEGSSVRKNVESGYDFMDADGKMINCASEDIIYYSTGSISSIEGMLLVDMNNFRAGIIDHYFLDSMMVLESMQDQFVIDNNNNSLDFKHFLLKTGPQHYVVASPKMTLNLGTGKPIELKGHVAELTYADDLGTVFSLTDGTDAWQYFSRNCTLTLQNGAVLNLGDMQMHDNKPDKETGEYKTQFMLADLEVSPASAIQVASASGRAWKPLKFVVNAIEGKAGAVGEEGLAGEAGEEGEMGDPGEAGQAGTAGETGPTNKMGATGTPGGFGKKGGTLAEDSGSDEEPEFVPFVNITAWSQNAATVKVTIKAENVENIIPNTTEAYIQDVLTGVKKYWTGKLDLSAGLDSYTNLFEGLQPNTQYRFIVNAQVKEIVKEPTVSPDGSTGTGGTTGGGTTGGGTTSGGTTGDGTTGGGTTGGGTTGGGTTGDGTTSGSTTVKNPNTIFAHTNLVTRTFWTDGLGFFVEKKSSVYITDQELANPNNNYPRDAVAGAALGLVATISGNQEIESITEAKFTYTDGTMIRELTSDECLALIESENGGPKVTFYGLPSNTDCVLSLKVKLVGGKEEAYSIQYKTLKATPEAYGVSFDVNENRYFVSMLSVRDPDEAVVNYTHEVYQCNAQTGELMMNTFAKSKTTTSLSTNFYQEQGIIDAGSIYGNRVLVTYFDNEKYVTKVAKNSDNWSGQSLSQSTQPHISYAIVAPGITATSFSIKMEIYPGENNVIFVGGDKRLMVQFTKGNYTTTTYYNSLNGWVDQSDDELDGTTIVYGSSWSPVITLDGLTPETNYVITVAGWVAPYDGDAANVSEAERRTIGTATITTAKQ